MNNLEQKVGEFCAAIQETKEYRDYREAAEIYDRDKAAQELMKDFQMAQQELAILRDGGFSGWEEQEKKLRSLLDEVKKNETINKFSESRRKMEILIGDLALAISNDIDFPFNLPPKKGCGCS